MVVDIPFRFDHDDHTYTLLDTGEERPHITQMLEKTGWVDARFYTDTSRDRGSAVHKMTADYDLGAIEDVAGIRSPYIGWLHAYVKAIGLMKPEIDAVEEAVIHPYWRYGGRPDRLVTLYGQKAVLEIKTGAFEKSHYIQTALQAELVAHVFDLPAHAVGRFVLYLKKNGKFELEEHKNPRDFEEALRVIRACC